MSKLPELTGLVPGTPRTPLPRTPLQRPFSPPGPADTPDLPRSLLGGLKQQLRKATQPPSFSKFRRDREREQQAARVYDPRRGIMQEVLTLSQTWSHGEPSGTADEESIHESSTLTPRPPARLSGRVLEARKKMEQVAGKQISEFAKIAERERIKQDYWHDFSELGSAKKVLSEFEEWQRLLHETKPTPRASADVSALSTTAPPSTSVKAEEDDWRNAPLGFTKLTPREINVSNYAKTCRETYCVPLGPRGMPVKPPSADKKALAANAHAPLAPQQLDSEVLDYQGWGIGSWRLDMFCNATGSSSSSCRHVNLSGNRIEDKSIPLLCAKLLPRVEILDLSSNTLGPESMKFMASGFTQIGRAPLMQLNLQGNLLGNPRSYTLADVPKSEVCAFIQALSDHCPQLTALSLAQNQLGRTGSELGHTIGRAVTSLRKLAALDLHWNCFHGAGAYQLIEGIMDNALNSGKLSRVDLSWNRLGNHHRSGGKAVVPAKALAEVFETNSTLFHLDISYNNIGSEDCALLAESLQKNSTLFGLHVAGNAASVDDFGNLVPYYPNVAWNSDAVPSEPTRITDLDITEVPDVESLVAFPINGESGSGRRFLRDCAFKRIGFSSTALKPEGKPLAARQVKEKSRGPKTPRKNDHHGHQSSKEMLAEQPLDYLSLRVQQCWICDRWQAQQIVWTPGISGSLPANEVKSVLVFVSADNFRLATRLEPRTNEVVWVCERMVPPSSSRILAFFQVNGHFEVAEDFPVRKLKQKVKKPLQEPKDEETEQQDFEVEYVNELRLQEYAVDNKPLVITEGSSQAGKVEVRPRKNEDKSGKANAEAKKEWKKEFSVLGSWGVATDAHLEMMLHQDLRLARSSSMPQAELESVKRALWPVYEALIATYRLYSIWGRDDHVFGIRLASLGKLLKVTEVHDRHFAAADLTSVAFQAHAVDKKLAKEIMIHSQRLLIRYQFVDTLLRIAEAKFLRSGLFKEVDEAVRQLLQHMAPVLEERLSSDQYFRQLVMREEVDSVLGSSLGLLRSVFSKFASLTAEHSKQQLMSLSDFYTLLEDADSFDSNFLHRQGALAFSLGTSWAVNETTSERFMRMDFVEFLMGICATVYMREHFHEEDLAELLSDYIADHLTPLVESRQSGKQTTLSATVAGLFKLADGDRKGFLTLAEFQNMVQDRNVELLVGRKIVKLEMAKLFDDIDADKGGTLSLEEVADGLKSLRKVTLHGTRLRQFLTEACNATASEKDGSLKPCEAVELVVQSTVKRKLMRAGIVPAHLIPIFMDMFEVTPLVGNQLESLLNELMFNLDDIDANTLTHFKRMVGGEVSMVIPPRTDAFISKVLQLATPRPIPRWKILATLLFKEADTDHSGGLSIDEFRQVLHVERLKAYCSELGFDIASVEQLFQMLDEDNSGDVSEEEFLLGVEELVAVTHGGLLTDEKAFLLAKNIREKSKVAFVSK